MRYARRLSLILVLASAVCATATLPSTAPGFAAERAKTAKAKAAQGDSGAAQPALEIKLEARTLYDEKQAAGAEIPDIPQARFAAESVKDFIDALPTAKG